MVPRVSAYLAVRSCLVYLLSACVSCCFFGLVVYLFPSFSKTRKDFAPHTAFAQAPLWQPHHHVCLLQERSKQHDSRSAARNLSGEWAERLGPKKGCHSSHSSSKSRETCSGEGCCPASPSPGREGPASHRKRRQVTCGSASSPYSSVHGSTTAE